MQEKILLQERILQFFAENATPALDLLAEAVTMLGESYPLILVLAFVYWNVSKQKGFILASVLVLSQLANNLTKIIFRAPRPFEKLDFIQGKRLETASGYSFPSGHSQSAAAFYTAGALMIRKPWAVIAAAFCILGVGISRIYLGVHWPVDAAAGIALGVLLAFLLSRFLGAAYGRKKTLRRIFLVLEILVLLLICGLYAGDVFFFRGALKLKDFFKTSGIFLGFAEGFFWEDAHVNFSPRSGGRTKKILRWILGLLGALALLQGLKRILPDNLLADFFRYAAPGLWISLLWPLAGKKLGLFAAAATEPAE